MVDEVGGYGFDKSFQDELHYSHLSIATTRRTNFGKICFYSFDICITGRTRGFAIFVFNELFPCFQTQN